MADEKKDNRGWALIAVLMVCSVFVGVLMQTFLVRLGMQQRERDAVRDTTTYVDTIPYYYPVAKDSVVVRYVTEVLPVVPDDEDLEKPGTDLEKDSAEVNGSEIPNTPDSARVKIPITQKKYSDSTYTAYISGYNAALDSIFVHPKTILVREKERSKRWVLGAGVGYGYDFVGRKGAPFVGVTVSYKLFEW